MTITLTWFDDTHKILLWNFDKNWTWEQFHQAVDESSFVAKDYTHSIDLILNLGDSQFPLTTAVIAHIRRGMAVATEQGGIVVLMSHNTFARVLVTIFSKVNPKLGNSFRVASSTDEALKAIRVYREGGGL